MTKSQARDIHILVTFPLDDDLVEEIKDSSPKVHVALHPTRQPEEIPPEVWEQTEILLTARTLPDPAQVPNLRWVQLMFAGVDQQIASPLFEDPKMVLTTLSGANAPQVAEHALALMLAMGHHMPDLFAHQSQNDWPTNKNELFSPHELRGSTVGIVGYGSVGRQIARLLQPFDVTLLASKRDLQRLEDDDYTPGDSGDPATALPRRLYPGPALRSMFKECDFVIVACPLTDETRGMIGAEQLAALPPVAYLIDVSRGGVVDHKALVQALREGRFAGAALDVFPEEPLPADSPLWEMPNVLISPHIAGISSHYNRRALPLFIQNLERYLRGEPLLNRVDAARGY